MDLKQQIWTSNSLLANNTIFPRITTTFTSLNFDSMNSSNLKPSKKHLPKHFYTNCVLYSEIIATFDVSQGVREHIFL